MPKRRFPAWWWLGLGCGLWIATLVLLGHARAYSAALGMIYLPLVAGGGTLSGAATWSGPIAISPRDGRVWVVNPDAGSVAVLDAERLALVATLPVGGEPWSLAFTPDGATLLVLDRAGGQLIALDPLRQAVRARITVGPEPGHVAVHPAGMRAYVSVGAAQRLVIIDLATLQIERQVATAAHPHALAISADGAQVYLTHFLAQPLKPGGMGADDGAAGLISVFSALGELERMISLPPDQHGFANQLAAISLFADRAWVPQIRAAPEQPNTLSTTVFAAVSSLDLAAGREDERARLNLNDEVVFGSPVNNPVAAVPSPDGQTLYVVLAGSNLIELVDVAQPERPRLLGFMATGLNPRGMALSLDGRIGYVMNYLSRSVTVLDLAQRTQIAEVVVAPETLRPELLRGKILFNTVADPRMAKSSWVSCASCHADGGTDGVTWSLADGPRQTPGIWNAGATLPWHWSAALDEAQDVEDSIHTLQFGLGIAPGADPPLLGAPNAGRSAELDALAAFLVEGVRTPQGLVPSAASQRGRALFVELGCVGCHGGPNWTISSLPGAAGSLDPDGDGMINSLLRDVGTASAADLRGATGFDVPALLGLALTAPYMHDGALPDLAAVLDSGHPKPGQARTRPLSDHEHAALIAFLLTLDATTAPVTSP
jgi:YVTN family beta-propeller protein